MTSTSTRAASQAQIDFINRLQVERAASPEAEAALQAGRTLWTLNGHLPMNAASVIIGHLQASPRKEAVTEDGQTTVTFSAPKEGMHILSDGRIFKVQRAVHGSGHLYAKELVTIPRSCNGCEQCDGEGFCTTYEARFEYSAGTMRLLSAATQMTLEQAKTYGALYGTCCVCGRTLTDENSIEAGIGPVCAGKF